MKRRKAWVLQPKNFPLLLFCFLSFFVVIPVTLEGFDTAIAVSVAHGFGRHGLLAYFSGAMLTESALAFVLRLRKVFVPYFVSLAVCLLVVFFLFCCAEALLVGVR